MELQRSRAAGAARLTHDRPAPFFFASPSGALSGAGPAVPIRVRARSVLAAVDRAVAEARDRGATRPLIAGALPFSELGSARLSLYDRAATGAVRAVQGASETSPALRALRVSMQPTPEAYERAVGRAVASIRRGELEKVVLARSLRLEAESPLDLPQLLSRLLAQNPQKYVFSCDVSEANGAARTLLGASPELLIAKRGSGVISHPLAGSAARSDDPREDTARATALAACPKNRAEHALVVEAVARTLAPYCKELRVPSEPSLVATPTMWHLGTRITGTLYDAELSSLELALALHPTPAVCGEPTPLARSVIDELEGFDRGCFAGFVGWSEAGGDGEWAVTIRCAEATEHALELYAGAGIVADSIPRRELEETTAKLNTILRALGIDHLQQVY